MGKILLAFLMLFVWGCGGRQESVYLDLYMSSAAQIDAFFADSSSQSIAPSIIEHDDFKLTIHPLIQVRAQSVDQVNTTNPAEGLSVRLGEDGVEANTSGDKESSAHGSFLMLIFGYGVMVFGGLIWAAKRAPSITSGYLGLVANSLPKGGGLVIMGVGALMVWGQELGPVIQLTGYAVAVLVVAKWGWNMYADKAKPNESEIETERYSK